ncbi:MAG: anthranilate synthase component I family protein [Bacteroidetes bacterium]|nr:anthranilate synthase component I family protein [Bacteroidota bacterium]MDA1119399.1 anthranilate synthase component I family protein [Bacteroidota bacterium]
MKKVKLKSNYRKLLADTVTPVSIYLRIRDRFANSLLLESSDYHGQENSFSFICCDPIAEFSSDGASITIKFPGQEIEVKNLSKPSELKSQLTDFIANFEHGPSDFKFITNGLFGYLAFDAVQHFEDIKFGNDKENQFRIPVVRYQVFRYVIAIDHFKNELYVFEHFPENDQANGLDELASLIMSKNVPSYDFSTEGSSETNFTDAEFLEIIKKGMVHCNLGDVFQIVLSRRFSRQFKGDEFQVYRALRSVNPSPYLFYFDYGSYKIFGSSPEAQIVVKGDEATIYPIAGTFKRTGDDQADAELAKKLYNDPKENSEHVMLVDLARNDLSKSCTAVKVETYKEIQYYSHVIHLVSKVTGKLEKGKHPFEIVASTFPAGTLSGAPKHMAMQLIDKYETVKRGYYGGAIGFMGFNGDFNHAIMIRSFLSQSNVLYYQAGAGVVAKSTPESEVQEVYNKLAALEKAIEIGEKI